MADDEERRRGSARSNRRDPARNARRDPPTIEGLAQDVTPPEAAPVEPITDLSSSTASLAIEEVPAAPVEPAPQAEPVTPPAADAEPVITPATEPVPEPAADAMHQAHEPPPQAAPSRPDTFETVPPAATEDRRTALIPLVIVGFLILAAGLIYLFFQLSSLPPDDSAAVADLKSRVAALEKRPAGDAGGLGDRLTRVDKTASDTQAGLVTLEKKVDGLAAAASAQSDVASRVADLQSAVTGLKTSLATVQSSVAAIPRPDIGKLESRMGELDQRLGALQAAVSNIPHVDLGPLTGKVDALETRLKPIEAEAQASAAPQQVAQRKAAPQAVTAQAIGDAIRTDQPFPQDLKALQALGADPARIAPLQAVADTGAPSLHDLQAMLADLRDRIVAQGAAPASGSYVDRLMAGASSLVQVRPLGSVVGDTPAAIVARMDDAIGSDDLAAALSDWKRLPEASQAASKALAERIKLRRDAEEAAQAIANSAIAAMAAPRG